MHVFWSHFRFVSTFFGLLAFLSQSANPRSSINECIYINCSLLSRKPQFKLRHTKNRITASMPVCVQCCRTAASAAVVFSSTCNKFARSVKPSLCWCCIILKKGLSHACRTGPMRWQLGRQLAGCDTPGKSGIHGAKQIPLFSQHQFVFLKKQMMLHLWSITLHKNQDLNQTTHQTSSEISRPNLDEGGQADYTQSCDDPFS